MSESKKIIQTKKVVKKGDKIVVYGAGKYCEESLVLNKEQAMLLYVDLHKILFTSKSNNR